MSDLTPADSPHTDADFVHRSAVAEQRCILLDSLPAEAFADLTRLAATLCRTTLACIAFSRVDEQQFRACIGIECIALPQHSRLFSRVSTISRPMLIPDTLLDPNFANDPAVVGDPGVNDAPCIRFFAGVPLLTPEGEAIGALCAMDQHPLQAVPQQQEVLESLARQIMAQIELRLENRLLQEKIDRRRQAETQQQDQLAALRRQASAYQTMQDVIVTDRQEAQSALARSEARARRIFDANIVGVINWNLDTGLITDANDVFLNMVGYTREDLAQGSLNWQEMTPPEWRERNWQGVAEIRARRSGAPYEKEYFHKDGSRIPIIIGGALFDDSTNEGVSFILDISERVRHLREIENLNARLRRSIQETHHRVKNNLQIISALVELQAEEGVTTVPAAAMHRIGQHTRSLAAIHDLLTNQAKTDSPSDSISTAAMLHKLIPLLETTTGGRAIRYHADDVCLPVREGASLALLVAEVVSNAVKHGQGDITLSFRSDDMAARLEVSDDGPGFPPDFDPETAGNTGLGLIASTGRHDLRGTITFANRTEGGATVSVVFPLPGVSPPQRSPGKSDTNSV